MNIFIFGGIFLWLLTLYLAYMLGWRKGWFENKAFEGWFQPIRDAAKGLK